MATIDFTDASVGNVSSALDALSVVNTGGGPALRGESSVSHGVHGINGSGASAKPDKGAGVLGESNTGFGVCGSSEGGQGVQGASKENDGMVGITEAVGKTGVLGIANAGGGAGVEGISSVSHGVHGINGSGASAKPDKGAGVLGESNTGFGVCGSSEGGQGVQGASKENDGMVGITEAVGKTGVLGIANAGGGAGVEGISSVSHGVHGINGSGASAKPDKGAGVWGESDTGTGVSGISDQGIGVFGQGGLRAGFFLGDTEVDGDLFVTGDIQLTGADYAEDFDTSEPDNREPGTVMALDDDGMLRMSRRPYDRQVAGVVPGAGGFRSAVVLDRQPDRSDRCSLALVGKVYCKVDASYGPVKVGDMLTTSPTPGHAMTAVDPAQAFGSTIGKALQSLEAGQGLVAVLVGLH